MSPVRVFVTLIIPAVVGGVVLAIGAGHSTSVHAAEKPLVSPVDAREDLDVYFPNTESLAPDEMRVVACGTGMPTTRAAQAAACFVMVINSCLTSVRVLRSVSPPFKSPMTF